MADLNDIIALTDKALYLENTDPNKAHACYEQAERSLYDYCLQVFRTQLDILANSPDYKDLPMVQIYNRILQSYKKLENNTTNN